VKATKVYRDYHLTEWTNPERRSAVGIICTIGPSVFSVTGQRTKATIEQLVRGGMDIARINLSHYPLAAGEVDSKRVDELVSIVKATRKASATYRRPVNIMFDTKGPEYRISGFRIPNWYMLANAPELRLDRGTRIGIRPRYGQEQSKVRCPILVLGEQDPPVPTDCASCTIHLDGNAATLRVEHTDFGVEWVVTRVAGTPPVLETGRLDGVTINAWGERTLRCVSMLKVATLRLSELRPGRAFDLVPDSRAELYVGRPATPVIYVEYECPFGEDIVSCRPKDPVYADNGKVGFSFSGCCGDVASVKFQYGQALSLRKSMNVARNARYSARNCTLAESDESYLRALLSDRRGEFNECPVDSIALSFTRSRRDLIKARGFLLRAAAREEEAKAVRLIAKIESPHCFWKPDKDQRRFDLGAERTYAGYEGILRDDSCWAVMVARGDLGTEMRPALIPKVQQELINRANAYGKPVIVATQLMLSMQKQLVPSRADVTDVHNAVMSGADIVMLSEETATGGHPVEALQQAREVVDQAVSEQDDEWRGAYLSRLKNDPTASEIMDHLGGPMLDLSLSTKSPVLFCYALTGGTVTRLTKYRPPKPLVAFARDERVARDLLFHFGVHPLVIRQMDTRRRPLKVRPEFDYPRLLRDYRDLVFGVVERAGQFGFKQLEDVAEDDILFGMLGADRKSDRSSDRAIVVFRYDPRRSGARPPRGRPARGRKGIGHRR